MPYKQDDNDDDLYGAADDDELLHGQEASISSINNLRDRTEDISITDTSLVQDEEEKDSSTDDNTRHSQSSDVMIGRGYPNDIEITLKGSALTIDDFKLDPRGEHESNEEYDHRVFEYQEILAEFENQQ